MSNKISIYDHTTGLTEVREMNEAELNDYALAAADKLAAEAEAESTATQKAALLARLGITADEAKLLIG